MYLLPSECQAQKGGSFVQVVFTGANMCLFVFLIAFVALQKKWILMPEYLAAAFTDTEWFFTQQSIGMTSEKKVSDLLVKLQV
jgi:hypothetical protein